METINLNFTNCRFVEDLHQVCKSTFAFPDFYGANLDALWDCLRDRLGNEPITVIVTGLSKQLNQKETADYMLKILEVFDDIHQEAPAVIFQLKE